MEVIFDQYPPPLAVRQLRCDYCQRFCGPGRLFVDEEGEYGVVLSWIAVCPRCEERHFTKGC